MDGAQKQLNSIDIFRSVASEIYLNSLKPLPVPL